MRIGTRAALALGFLAFAASAAAQETPATQTIVEPQWITNPRMMDLGAAFPPVPLALAQSGRAVLDCAVALDTRASCTVVEESPAGMGFGAAALRLSQDWRMSPRVVDGQPQAGGHKRVPLNFALPEGTVAAPLGDGFTVRARRSRASEARLYPENARVNGVEGETLVGCVMRAGDRLDCGVETESPSGHGFGEAAMRAIRESYALRERGALAQGMVLRMPVNFRITGN